VIMLVCFGDTGAYFIGSHFGKHSLAPKTSPKKSWEGFAAQLVIGSIAGMGTIAFLPLTSAKEFGLWLVFGIVLIIVSVFGDLFESVMKRQCEVKDSGSLLPGHGGVLDRVDSLLAAYPIFALVVIVLRWL